MSNLLQLGDGLAADPLSRRVGRDEPGVLCLQRSKLVQQRVVLVVADLRIVEDVVPVVVVFDLLPQLGSRALRAAHSTSRAAGAIRRARS